ncbi:unnamed protein product [Amoebophrya sp. A120]|nr:unnamed protein product [Amoebophrya sp. A120]|eukprot:GSA120T00024861001.1
MLTRRPRRVSCLAMDEGATLSWQLKRQLFPPMRRGSHAKKSTTAPVRHSTSILFQFCMILILLRRRAQENNNTPPGLAVRRWEVLTGTSTKTTWSFYPAARKPRVQEQELLRSFTTTERRVR